MCQETQLGKRGEAKGNFRQDVAKKTKLLENRCNVQNLPKCQTSHQLKP